MSPAIQPGPLETRKTLMIRIVTSAKTELTMPRPRSPSTPAASPMRAGSSSARSWSLSTIW
jgi:hypothetical protein